MYRFACLLTLFATSICFAQGIDPLKKGIQWSTMTSGSDSKLNTQLMQAVQTEGAWQVLWSKLTKNAPGTAPTIDWNKQNIVVINLGTRPGRGGSVYVESVRSPRPHTVEVSYVEREGYTRKSGSSETSSPFTVIRMDRTPGVVQFVRKQASYPDQYRPPYWGGYEPVPWRPVICSQQSTSKKSGTKFITTESEWKSYWKEYFSSLPVPAAPVAWSTDALIAIHLGARGAGSSVVVQGIISTSPTTYEVLYYDLNPSSIPGASLFSPYLWLGVSKAYGAPKFKKINPGQW